MGIFVNFRFLTLNSIADNFHFNKKNVTLKGIYHKVTEYVFWGDMFHIKQEIVFALTHALVNVTKFEILILKSPPKSY